MCRITKGAVISLTRTDFGEAFSQIAQRAVFGQVKMKEDVERDGIIYCGSCGAPKQAWIDWPADENGNVKRELLPVTCACEQERYERDKEQRRKEKFEISLSLNRKIIGSDDRSLSGQNFEADDAPQSPISVTVRRYVEHWDEMRKDNIGILFFGSKGTGKSFYAASVVNALAEKGVMAGFATMPSLMSLLQGKWDKTEIMDAICRFQLLVLDDIGAERASSYSAETAYNIINARYESRKPTIVTTNVALADMQKETDPWYSRIYDRLSEMCPIRLKMTGESRRNKIYEERRDKARAILSGRAVHNGEEEPEEKG